MVQRCARIAVVLQQGDDADAVLRPHGELVRQHDLGDAVAIDIPGRQIDHPMQIPRDDMALPGWIFKPYQFGHAAGQRDEIDLAVVIHIAGHHLVAACEICRDGMLAKF